MSNGMVSSNGDAKRMIKQGAGKLNGEKVEDLVEALLEAGSVDAGLHQPTACARRLPCLGRRRLPCLGRRRLPC